MAGDDRHSFEGVALGILAKIIILLARHRAIIEILAHAALVSGVDADIRAPTLRPLRRQFDPFEFAYALALRPAVDPGVVVGKGIRLLFEPLAKLQIFRIVP